MLKNIGYLLVFVIFLFPADVYSYRPFITEDAGVSGLGEQKVEMGFVGSRQNEYWYNYISLLYGIGLGKAEILVETPYCMNDEARGLEGIILAAKINVFEVDDTLMLGAKAGYEFPDDCYGVSVIATKKIGILVMHSQIGLKRAFNDTVGLFGLGFEYQLLQHLSVIIDNFTENDGDTLYHRVLTGVIYSFNSEIALDVATGYCYANNHNNYREYFTVAGISFIL